MGSKDKIIKVCEPNIGELETKAVLNALKTSQLSGRSPVVKEFEDKFAKYIGTTEAISVNSGSMALLIAIRSLGFSFTNEVIIPAYAYIAVANAVVQAGLTPVLVDVESNGNIDPDEIEKAITPRTKAIICVHTYGHPCDMDRIMLLARKYHLTVIEDAAESHGAEYNGHKTGSIGHIGIFSFFANKTITTGEGGMITTNLPFLADECRRLRDQYAVEINGQHYWHPEVGYSACMSGLQASLGIAQLSRIKEFLDIKKAVASFYDSSLATIRSTYPLIRPLPRYEYAKPSHWMYAIIVSSKGERDSLIKFLDENGIQSRNGFPSIHWQKRYKSNDSFPISEELSNCVLYLPSGTTLTRNELQKVVNTIKKYYEN